MQHKDYTLQLTKLTVRCWQLMFCFARMKRVT